MIYYNEFEPFAAQWLSNLMDAGLIPAGDVDERSIKDVTPGDLRGYAQCHFFAGIGGWSRALQIARVSPARALWTGSCPCQPFSSAGKRKGVDDDRHLWPVWFDLIRQCRPPIIFGEQVAAAIGGGWLDAVFADLEGEGYACGAAVLPACGVGAPHIRQRLWFVADADGARAGRDARGRTSTQAQGNREWNSDGRNTSDTPLACCATRVLAHSDPAGRSEQQSGGLLDEERQALRNDADGCGGVGDSSGDGRQACFVESGMVREPRQEGHSLKRPSSLAWADCDWLPCTDGKARPVEPGTFPLASGILGRVGRLRAYGNSIVPQAAAAFIGAYFECRP